MVDYEKINTEGDRKNPRTKAGIFSTLSFWWLNKIFSTGNKRPLENKDLFPLIEDDKCKEATERLQQLWDEKITNEAPNTHAGFPRELLSWWTCAGGRRLFSALLQLYSGSDYALVCLLGLLCGLGNVLQPVFLSLLLAELLKPSRDVNVRAYVYAAGICLSSLLRVLTSNHFAFKAYTIPLRWKSAVVGMTYKKVSDSVENNIASDLAALLHFDCFSSTVTRLRRLRIYENSKNKSYAARARSFWKVERGRGSLGA